MSDNIYGTTPDKIHLSSLLLLLRQCVDPAYRNYFSPYATDSHGRPNDQRFFGAKVGIDHITLLAHNIEQLAQRIEIADPDGLPDDFREICHLYNRWYHMAKILKHEYSFSFPERKYYNFGQRQSEEPEFDFLAGRESAGTSPPVPYPAAPTAADEATRSRLQLDRRYATGADRSDILDRLGNSN